MDLKTLKSYFEVYENPFSVLFNVVRSKFPFEAKLKSGHMIQIKSKRHAWFYTTLHGLDIKHVDDTFIEFKYGERLLRFYYDLSQYISIGEVFRDGIYNIDVKGRVVVDIGSGIGDSSVYFALKGAKKVYAFDLDIEFLKKNIKENGFTDIIIPIKCECGSVNNLDVITYNYNIPEGSVLKVDCEGCEYDFFAKSSTLNKYSSIIIEYHNGTQYLPELLRSAGFSVKIKQSKHNIGLIYANYVK